MLKIAVVYIHLPYSAAGPRLTCYANTYQQGDLALSGFVLIIFI